MANQTPEQMQAAAERQHNAEVGEIIKVGQHEFGDARFDDASGAVAKAMGQRTAEFLAAARQFDNPHRLIERLGSDPDELERFSKLGTARMLVDMARMESHTAPGGRVRTGAEPAWKGQSARGSVPDREWSTSYGDGLTDEAWSKEFDRRQAGKRRR